MFIKTLRRLSVLLVSGCIYMVSVESPSSSPAIVSLSSSPAIPIFDIDAQFISPHFGPFLRIGNGTNTTHAAFTPDIPISIPNLITTDRPGLISTFDVDFSDLDIQTLEVVASAVLALARTIRNSPAEVGDSMVVEGVKMLLFLRGLDVQVSLGLGEGVDKVDRLLTWAVLRLAIELLFGTLGALLLGCHRKHRDFTSWIAPFAEEVDIWALGQFHSAVLIFLVHAGIRPVVLQVLANAVLAGYLLKGLFACFRYALPPPPPPRVKKKKRWFN
ncbi:hypothetical protein C8R44DRAFT_304925 [Mycena epipterygia]|nr:hypothetical protein C8R44DRAFT_304925 [Mycena epipterygia]